MDNLNSDDDDLPKSCKLNYQQPPHASPRSGKHEENDFLQDDLSCCHGDDLSEDDLCVEEVKSYDGRDKLVSNITPEEEQSCSMSSCNSVIHDSAGELCRIADSLDHDFAVLSIDRNRFLINAQVCSVPAKSLPTNPFMNVTKVVIETSKRVSPDVDSSCDSQIGMLENTEPNFSAGSVSQPMDDHDQQIHPAVNGLDRVDNLINGISSHFIPSGSEEESSVVMDLESRQVGHEAKSESSLSFLDSDQLTLPSDGATSQCEERVTGNNKGVGQVRVLEEHLAASDTSKCQFEELPYEIKQKIFSYFSQRDLCRTVCLVSKNWSQYAMDPIHWHTVHLKFTPDMYIDFQCLMERLPLLKQLFLQGSEEIGLDQMKCVYRNCPLLRELGLGFCDSVDYDMVRCISTNFRNLTSLNVEGCMKINAACVEMLCRMPQLSDLNLSHCNFLEDESIIDLASSLTCLWKFNIDGISWITDRAVKELVKHQGDNLTELDLDGAELTDLSFQYLASCTKLQHLSLSFAELITDVSLYHLQKMSILQSLKIKKGGNLTNAALCELFNSNCFPNLKSLDLSECSDLRDSGVLAMVKGIGKTIECLSLEWCWEITDIGLTHIVDWCGSLHCLDLIGLELLKGHSLHRIPEDLPKLTFLNLQQCNRIEDEIVIEVIKLKRDLVAIHYYGEEYSVDDDS